MQTKWISAIVSLADFSIFYWLAKWMKPLRTIYTRAKKVNLNAVLDSFLFLILRVTINCHYPIKQTDCICRFQDRSYYNTLMYMYHLILSIPWRISCFILALIYIADESLEKVALMDDDSDDNYNTSDIESENVFTVEEAVESIGFGFFQIRLYIICGLFTVSTSLFIILIYTCTCIYTEWWFFSTRSEYNCCCMC